MELPRSQVWWERLHKLGARSSITIKASRGEGGVRDHVQVKVFFVRFINIGAGPGLGMAHAENDGRFSGINPNAHKPSRKVALEPQTTTSRLPSSLFRQS